MRDKTPWRKSAANVADAGDDSSRRLRRLRSRVQAGDDSTSDAPKTLTAAAPIPVEVSSLVGTISLLQSMTSKGTKCLFVGHFILGGHSVISFARLFLFEWHSIVAR